MLAGIQFTVFVFPSPKMEPEDRDIQSMTVLGLLYEF
jgi:hypothetical protein